VFDAQPAARTTSVAAARRTATLVIAIVLAIALALLVVFLPVPYLELSPGASCDTLAPKPSPECRDAQIKGPVLTIDKGVKTYPTTDHLFFTTVGLSGGPGQQRLTLYDALRGWFDSKIAVIPRDLIFPPGTSTEAVNCGDTKDQEASQNNATVAALTHLGYKVPVQPDVYVDNFAPTSPAREAGIAICDDIVAVNGLPVTSEAGLAQIIATHKVGEVVRVEYVHDKEHKTAQVKLIASPVGKHQPIIGVVPQHVDISKPPFQVAIDAGDIGGPSAGLMYTLGIIELLTPGDLTGGVTVAGTGEIDTKGKVGEIGGIQQKLISARRQGATVFLVPKANCPEAVHAQPKGLRLAMVDSLDDALAVLTALRHEPGGVIHDCTA
jgi:PDZ domain-containing protein